MQKVPQKIPLDSKDRAVLKVLMKEPRMAISEIARETGLQRDTVLYRINRMEKRGLISKYHLIIEPAVLGFPQFMLVLIRLKAVSPVESGVFIQKLRAHSRVTHVARLIGKYDYFVQVAAEHIQAFDSVLSDIKQINPGIIQDVEVAHIIDGIKTDDFSGLVDGN